nr:hypothetical protein SHINE37_10453 [Rhizobiaceae bacterium]
MDEGESLRPARYGGGKALGQGGRPLLERAQLRLPQVRRALLPRQGSDARLRQVGRGCDRPDDHSAQHGGADPDRSRLQCRPWPRILAAWRRPQFFPQRPYAAPCGRIRRRCPRPEPEQPGGYSEEGDGGAGRPLLLRLRGCFGAAQRLQVRRQCPRPDRALWPGRGGRRGRALREHHGRGLAKGRAVAEEAGKALSDDAPAVALVAAAGAMTVETGRNSRISAVNVFLERERIDAEHLLTPHRGSGLTQPG